MNYSTSFLLAHNEQLTFMFPETFLYLLFSVWRDSFMDSFKSSYTNAKCTKAWMNKSLFFPLLTTSFQTKLAVKENTVK